MIEHTVEDILLGGIIEATTKYGEDNWLWIGELAFKEMALQALAQKLHKDYPSFKRNLRKNLLFWWRSEFFKSWMIEYFAEKVLRGSLRVHSIGTITEAAMRGSVTIKGNISFKTPAIVKGDIICCPEFHTITNVKGLGSLFLEWFGRGRISVENAYTERIPGDIKANIFKKYGNKIIFDDDSYKIITDSVFLVGCHTHSDAIRAFSNQVYNRMTIITIDEELLQKKLFSDIMRLHGPKEPSKELVEAWKYMANMKVNGDPPDFPDKWIDKLDYYPRMAEKLIANVYAYMVSDQPRLHGYILKEGESYPHWIMNDDLFDRALEHMDLYEEGEKALLRYLRGWKADEEKAKSRKRKEYGDAIEAVMKEHGMINPVLLADKTGKNKETARRILRSFGYVMDRYKVWVKPGIKPVMEITAAVTASGEVTVRTRVSSTTSTTSTTLPPEEWQNGRI